MQLLTELCLGCVGSEAIKDAWAENVCDMFKEVSDNISRDKNNTIFAFTNAFV